MALILGCSAGGSPGVTTTMLGLALAWPRDVLLADCDKHPNQAVLAGYLRGLPAGGRGLSGLAQAYRTQEAGSSIRLVDQSVVLAEQSGRRRRFLPGFTHPRAALLFDRYWSRLVDQFVDLGASGTDVLADCGRLDADGLPEALLRRAQAVVLVTRSDLPSLAMVRLFLPDLVEATAAAGTDLLMVVVGAGRPYSSGEIARLLDVPLLAELPWDPTTAAALRDGAPSGKRATERPLWRGLHALSVKLATRAAVLASTRAGDPR